jgi:DNA-binding NarL/FixJ family response regulator
MPEPAPDATVRVLIADDHGLFAEALEAILSADGRIEVAGRAHDGKQALELAMRLKPDVVLMDISMPRVDGIAATRRIKSNWPHVAVVGLSIHGDTYLTKVMLKSGAAEVISKEKAAEELYGAIKRAVALSHSESSNVPT